MRYHQCRQRTDIVTTRLMHREIIIDGALKHQFLEHAMYNTYHIWHSGSLEVCVSLAQWSVGSLARPQGCDLNGMETRSYEGMRCMWALIAVSTSGDCFYGCSWK